MFIEVRLALLLDANKVVIKIVNIADAQALHMGDILGLVISVAYEFTVWDVILRLLIFFENVTWEDVKAVNFLHLTFGL